MTAQGKKSAEQLREEHRTKRMITVATAVASVINTTVRYGCWAFLGYCAWQSVQALAGQTTVASIGAALIAKIGLSKWAAFAFGGGGVGYGWRQRTLRRQNIGRLETRIRELETRLDRGRTSSRLTRRGDTRPEDQL